MATAWHGRPDEMIGHLIAHAKAQAQPQHEQQGMFDTAVADSKAARAVRTRAAREGQGHAAGGAREDRARSRCRRRRRRRRGGPGPRAAQGDPRRMARALRDVHAGAEGGREATCCRSTWRMPNRSARRCTSTCREVRRSRRADTTDPALRHVASGRARPRAGLFFALRRRCDVDAGPINWKPPRASGTRRAHDRVLPRPP